MCMGLDFSSAWPPGSLPFVTGLRLLSNYITRVVEEINGEA